MTADGFRGQTQDNPHPGEAPGGLRKTVKYHPPQTGNEGPGA